MIKEDVFEKAKLFYLSGNTIKSSAKQYNIPYNHLRKFLKQIGVKKSKIDYFLKDNKFGKLIAISPNLKKEGKYFRVFWLCKCECGSEQFIRQSFLTKEKYAMCGQCAITGKNNVNWKGTNKLSGSYWDRIKQRSKIPNRNLNVTIDHIWELYEKQNGKCALTGMEISFPEKVRDLSSSTASLDRIDSSKGYEYGNLQWVHKDINRMKTDFDNEYFIYLCKNVAKKFA